MVIVYFILIMAIEYYHRDAMTIDIEVLSSIIVVSTFCILMSIKILRDDLKKR